MNRELLLQPTRRRVRAVVSRTVIGDSSQAWLMVGGYKPPLYELGSWWFDRSAVRDDLLTPAGAGLTCDVRGRSERFTLTVGDRVLPGLGLTYPEPLTPGWEPLADLISFAWNDVDQWFEEDEEVWVHPRGPYHRVDVCTSSRHVRVSLDGTLLADSHRPLALFETGMPTRWYLPPEDVRLEHLGPSPTHTQCPYKGVADFHTVLGVADLAWSYPLPVPECRRIDGHICFFDERVDVELDGVAQSRPHTKWDHEIPDRDVL